MAFGWDADISVYEHPSGWAAATSRIEGNFLQVITDSLNEGTEVRDRRDRIVRGMFLKASSMSVERAMPRGQITFEPRTDDILPFLMGFFQAVDSVGTMKGGTDFYGTLTFVSVNDEPDWSGNTWGTAKSGSGSAYGGATVTTGAMYPISIRRRYGADITGNNTLRFDNALVDTLEWHQPANEDLQCIAGIRAKNVTAETNATTIPGGAGSYSTFGRYVDWLGTVQVGGTTYDITQIRITGNRNVTDKITLGNRAPVAFPWAGRPSIEGSFDLAIATFGPYDANTSYSIQAHWQISANEWMQLVIPDARIRPFEKPIGGGETQFLYSIPFIGYAQTGTPALVARVMGTFRKGVDTGSAIAGKFSFITAP